MNELNLRASAFENNTYESRKINTNKIDAYIYHNVDIFNSIFINETEHRVVYQTGHSYEMNDYNMPSNELQLYQDNTSELLSKIDALCEDDLNDLSEEDLAEIIELCSDIKNIDDVIKLFHFLRDNFSNAQNYLGNLNLDENSIDEDEEENKK